MNRLAHQFGGGCGTVCCDKTRSDQTCHDKIYRDKTGHGQTGSSIYVRHHIAQLRRYNQLLIDRLASLRGSMIEHNLLLGSWQTSINLYQPHQIAQPSDTSRRSIHSLNEALSGGAVQLDNKTIDTNRGMSQEYLSSVVPRHLSRALE